MNICCLIKLWQCTLAEDFCSKDAATPVEFMCIRSGVALPIIQCEKEGRMGAKARTRASRQRR